MNTNTAKYVNMDNVIGPLAQKYGTPYMRFDDLVTLGKRVVIIYGLDKHCKTIPFATLCEYIQKYINTPFGAKMLKDLNHA